MSEERRSHVRRSDPATPFVIDTRELGRRPGAMRRDHRTLPAPAGLGSDVIGVPEGTSLELDVRLEAVSEGVLVSGTVHTVATGECARCLDEVQVELDVDLQELFVYPDGRDRREPVDEDEPMPLVQEEHVNLEPTVRDEVVLALPLQPLCRDDCPGLCPECGMALADSPGHHHEITDPRWAALRALSDQKES